MGSCKLHQKTNSNSELSKVALNKWLHKQSENVFFCLILRDPKTFRFLYCKFPQNSFFILQNAFLYYEVIKIRFWYYEIRKIRVWYYEIRKHFAFDIANFRKIRFLYCNIRFLYYEIIKNQTKHKILNLQNRGFRSVFIYMFLCNCN